MPGYEFFTPLDLARNELLNARLQFVGGDVAAAVEGMFWYDSVAHKPRYQSDVGPVDFAGGDAATLGGNGAAYFLDRANHTGSQALETVSGHDKAVHDALGVNAATLDGDAKAVFERVASKGAADGYAALDGGGKIPSAQLPAIAITDVFVVASEAAMLALTAETGDVAIRTDLNDTFILRAEPASTLGSWQQVLKPTGGGGSVTTVTGAAPITSTGGATPEIALADLGVTSAKLADGAVTPEKLSVPSKRSMAQDIGATTAHTATHNWGTRDVTGEVRRTTDPWDTVGVKIERPTINTVLARFSVAPAAGAFRLLLREL